LRGATLVELFSGVRRSLRGEAPGRHFAIAVTWAGIYLLLAIFVLGQWLRREPQIQGDRALFYTISAISNVGLSHEPLSVTVANSFLLSAGMLLGRILPIGILWWMASEPRSVSPRSPLQTKLTA
jgi:Trk-type K+ transport system membrane component